MENKYVVENIATNKFLQLDFHTGENIIWVDKFTQAYLFDSKMDVLRFFNMNRQLDLKKHKLYRLSVMAYPTKWE